MEKRKRILAVVVLYKMTCEQSRGLTSLLKIIAESKDAAHSIDLMVCDNTPYEQAMPDRFTGQFHRDVTNPGLAHWYNMALRNAAANGIDWILVLDQDTEATAEYVAEVIERTSSMEEDRGIVAMFPKLVQNGVVCSPLTPPTYRHPLPFDRNFTGVAHTRLHVFNSGSVFRVSAVQDAGGFPEEFPLDYLDHATYAALQSRGGRLFVLQSMLEHELSSVNIHRTDPAAVARHCSTLVAERKFYQLNGSTQDRIFRRVRLLRGGLGVLIKHRAVGWSLRMVKAALH